MRDRCDNCKSGEHEHASYQDLLLVAAIFVCCGGFWEMESEADSGAGGAVISFKVCTVIL